ncbi:MAG TPA: fasciclin domain-containing protein [Phnomibacter sp.]|nr:fasciclin domain-containing protein [Phnomibacter sp.]
MKMKFCAAMVMASAMLISCNESGSSSDGSSSAIPEQKGGQSSVQDDESRPDVVKVAVGSADHTTLVTALKAADYVDVLSNAGPFTVFAPVNAAFDALPKGTVENLLKKENQRDLRNILEYHVYVGKLNPDLLQDGQTLGMVSGHNATIARQGDDIKINGASVKATVDASNGIIYVIDQVLLPPQ